MGKFLELFSSWMLVGLVVISLLSFGFFYQEDNEAENKFMEDSLMNETYNSLRENLGGLRDESQAQKTLFESENPTSGFGTILLFSIVSSGKVFNSMIIAVFNTTIKLPLVILGIDPIVLSVVSAMLLLAIILYLWATYKLGG